MGILVTIIALVLVFLFTAALTVEGFSALHNYIDIPSLLILLLLVIPVLISAGMLKDFLASFQRAFSARVTCTRVELQRSMEAVKLTRKCNYAAGLFGFLVSFVFVCKGYDSLGEYVFWINMAVAILPLVYAVMFDLVFLAVYGRLKKRYMDFMQMGYEMTEKEPQETAVRDEREEETAVVPASGINGDLRKAVLPLGFGKNDEESAAVPAACGKEAGRQEKAGAGNV